MRKFIVVSMVALSLISAAQAAPILKDGKEIISKHPLAVEYRSKEYGGTKDAIDAYSDGVGVYVGTVNPDKRVNQAPMAELVEKYGESAKAKGIMVAEEVAYGSVATEADRTLLAKVIDANAIHPDGSACDDGNVITINDKYMSGICVGTLVPNGTVCNDGNSGTIKDKYISGVCLGVNFYIENSYITGATRKTYWVRYTCGNTHGLTASSYDSTSYSSQLARQACN